MRVTAKSLMTTIFILPSLFLLSCSDFGEIETNADLEAQTELSELKKSVSDAVDRELMEISPTRTDKREHGHIIWHNTFGGIESDYLSSIVLTPDGGALLAGTTHSKGAGRSDMYLVRIDQNGKQLWEKTYGGTEKEDVSSIILTSDGGALLAGMFRSRHSSKPGMYVVKVDADGKQLWDNNYGLSNYDALSSIVLMPDGGALLGGTSRPEGRTVSDMYLVKIDQDGNQLWDKTYGTADEADYITSLALTSDGVLLGGFTLKGQRDYEMYLVKVDLDGALVWEKHYGKNTHEELMWSVASMPDDGALLGGTTEPIGDNNQNTYLVRVNKNGDKLWDKNFGGGKFDVIKTVVPTADGGALLGGSTSSSGYLGTDMYLVKIDRDGNQLWDQTYGDSGPNQIKSLALTSDGGAILGGSTSKKGAGEHDIYLIKIDNIGP